MEEAHFCTALSTSLSLFLSPLSSLSFPPSRQTVSGCLFCPCWLCCNRGGVRCGAAVSSRVSQAIEWSQPGGDRSWGVLGQLWGHCCFSSPDGCRGASWWGSHPLRNFQLPWVSLVQTFSWTRTTLATESLVLKPWWTAQGWDSRSCLIPLQSPSEFLTVPLHLTPSATPLASDSCRAAHRTLWGDWGPGGPEHLWTQPRVLPICCRASSGPWGGWR